jgi:hypothetical protein
MCQFGKLIVFTKLWRPFSSPCTMMRSCLTQRKQDIDIISEIIPEIHEENNGRI